MSYDDLRVKTNKPLNLGNNKEIQLQRRVDFNQGVDARLINKVNIAELSRLEIKPLRIAFDDIKFENEYRRAVWLAADAGIKTLSYYILYNYRDTPRDFYRRLRNNIELNSEFKAKRYKTRIWSFPMRYSPVFGVESKGRKYIGKNWNKNS